MTTPDQRTSATSTRPMLACPTCLGQHRSWRRVARCRWPNLGTFTLGPDGPWALAAFCDGRPGLVSLWPDRDAAAARQRQRCGATCRRQHVLVDLRERSRTHA